MPRDTIAGGEIAMSVARKTQMLWQVAACVVCAAVTWRYRTDLWDTEFIGGWVTGPMLESKFIGDLLLVLAAPVTFFFRRVGAVVALFACLCCLPLYLYMTAPGPFRWVMGGQWKAPLITPFIWDWWTIGGIASMGFVAFVCVRGFRPRD